MYRCNYVPLLEVFSNTDSARNHENNHQLLVHFMIHTQRIIVAHSSWRKEKRYCFNFIIFRKKEAQSDEEDPPATAGRARKKRVLCFVNFIFHLWEHDFIIQPVSCSI